MTVLRPVRLVVLRTVRAARRLGAPGPRVAVKLRKEAWALSVVMATNCLLHWRISIDDAGDTAFTFVANHAVDAAMLAAVRIALRKL